MNVTAIEHFIGPGDLYCKTSLDRIKLSDEADGQCFDEPSAFSRAPFFCSDPINTNVAPNGRTFCDPNFRHGRTGGMYVHHANAITLLGGDAAVLHNGELVYDTTFDLAPWEPQSNASRFLAGQWVSLKKRLKVTRQYSRGDYFIGFNGRYTNYCHWIQQTMPWHAAYLEMKAQYPGLKLVLPPFENGLFRYQTLKLLGITDDEVVIIDDNEAASFDSAFFCSRVDLWIPPSYSVTAATKLGESVKADQTSSERIFLHRRVDRRKFANFEEHRELLERRGFQIVEFEDASVARQISALKRARFVIAEHGAAIINIMFCKPGARILELFNPVCVQPAFWSIASACNLDYGFLVGEHTPMNGCNSPDWNSAYSISTKRMEVAIDALLAFC